MSKISIVMPVYNSEKYLEDCLNSLVNQTFKNFELICVNDGSTDNSLKILNEFNEKYNNFITIINQENTGSGAARNNGFNFVKSETVLFLDSDDYFYPDFLEKMYNKYLETNSDVIICRYDVVLPDGKFYQKAKGINEWMLPQKNIFNKKDFPKYLFNFVNFATWNKLIKTSLIQKYNLQFENIPYSNDVYFTLSTILFAEKISIVNSSLLKYNFLNANSLTINRNKNNIYIFETFKKLKEQINDNRILEISLYNAYISAAMYTLNFVKGEKRKEYLKLIKQNVHLLNKKDIYRPYLYYRLLLIKKLPVECYIFLYKTKCIIKRLIPNIIKKKFNIK